MMFFDTYVGMDITCSNIRIIAVKGNVISKWESAVLPEGLVKDGVILNPEAVAVVMDTLLKSLKLSRNKIICTVTGLPFLYRTISMPGSELNMPDEAIERTARKEMSLVGEDMQLLWQSLGPNSASGEGDINYFVLGVPKVSLEPLMETFKIAKIKPYMVGIKPLALARAAALKDACVVSLENNYFDIVLVANGLVRVIHSVSPVVRAEEKNEIVNEFVDAFNKAVKSYNRDYSQEPFPGDTPILLAGEFSSNSEIPGLIQEATGHPTSLLQPIMEIPPDMPAVQYAANIGLLLKELHQKVDASQYHDININLVASVNQNINKKQKLVYGGYAVAAVIIVALLFQTINLKSEAAAKVDSLKQQSTESAKKIADLQKANKDYLAAKGTADEEWKKSQADLATMSTEKDQISGQKKDYAVRVSAMLQAFPKGTDYDSIDMDFTRIVYSGYSNNVFDVVTLAGNLEKVEYFPVARIAEIKPIIDEGVTIQVSSVIDMPDTGEAK